MNRNPKLAVRSAMSAAIATAVLAAATIAVTPTAVAATTWSVPKLVDENQLLTSVSCPSASFCMAVDYGGNYLTWNGASWSAPRGDQTSTLVLPLSVSCPSASFCMAADDAGAEEWDGTSWGNRTILNALGKPDSVSCPSVSFCMEVEDEGGAAAWNGVSWSAETNIDHSGLLISVSCPSASFCVAVDDSGRAVRWNGNSWSVPALVDANQNLTSVSCPTASFCAAVDAGGDAIVWNGNSWSAPASVDESQNLTSVSCSTAVAPSVAEAEVTSFCAAVDQGGGAVTWNGTSWSAPTEIDGGGGFSGGPTSVSCPLTSFCWAVDNNGNAFTTSAGQAPHAYVALGDSFSSGEGAVTSYPKFPSRPDSYAQNNPSFYDGTDKWGNGAFNKDDICHRSKKAYSTELALHEGLQRDWRKQFVACSGAVLAQLWEPTKNVYKQKGDPTDQYNEPAQLAAITGGTATNGNYGSPNPHVALVTLTIGGNDALFSPIIRACIHAGPIVLPGCEAKIKAGLANSDRVLDAPKHGLADTLTEIHTLAPNAMILLGGYPHLFTTSPSKNGCQVGVAGVPLTFPATTVRLLNNTVDTLDAHLKALAAGATDVHYVDPVPAFSGHGLCDKPSYFNGAYASVTTADPKYWSFHPTVAGQHAYATAFEHVYERYR